MSKITRRVIDIGPSIEPEKPEPINPSIKDFIAEKAEDLDKLITELDEALTCIDKGELQKAANRVYWVRNVLRRINRK
jgi:soluble cytochrome b562